MRVPPGTSVPRSSPQAACAIEVAIDEQLARVTRQARQQARREKAAAVVDMKYTELDNF